MQSFITLFCLPIFFSFLFYNSQYMYLLANLMQLGGFFIWSYSYQLIKQSSVRYKALAQAAEPEEVPKEVNKDFDANAQTQLLRGTTDDQEDVSVLVASTKSSSDPECQIVRLELPSLYLLNIMYFVY